MPEFKVKETETTVREYYVTADNWEEAEDMVRTCPNMNGLKPYNEITSWEYEAEEVE